MYNLSNKERDAAIKLLSWHLEMARDDNLDSANKIRESKLLVKKLQRKKKWNKQ